MLLLDESDPLGFNTPLGTITVLACLVSALVLGVLALYRNRKR